MKRLNGKVALITGTGGQQGRAAALLFAKEGARVVGCDVNKDAASQTLEMVRDAGVSKDLVTFRIRMTGVEYQYRAARRRA